MTAKVIKFPEKEYILRCHECKTNIFYVILNSENYNDVRGVECSKCGQYTEIKREEKWDSEKKLGKKLGS